MVSDSPEQLTLLRETVRRSRTKEPAGIAGALPIARVAVDVSLPHLDRPFDYLVPEDLSEAAQPGVRVKVRFAGKDLDGFVLARLESSEHDGKLMRIRKAVSPEQVLTPEVADLCRAVADRYAGVLADVTRLAVPPRHAKVEGEALRCDQPVRPVASTSTSEWSPYPAGFLDAVRRTEAPRAIWTAVPGAGWALAFAQAAAVCASTGRGALLLVPDARDLERLASACTTVLGADGFVMLSADLGPTARYRAFLSTLRGCARVVIGTRAAAFAPVADLGLVALWDDGDDSYAEPRAPYPHAREVLLLRAHRQKCAFLLGGFARSAEAAALLESGWAAELIAGRTVIRSAAPAVHIAGESDRDLARDPAVRAARLPHQAFETAREGLKTGPVLVQVPRAGYLPSLVCQTCRTPSRCSVCGGSLRHSGSSGPASCSVCGRPAADHRCPECGDTRMRAAVVGARRTAEELGRAFPGVLVRTSGGDKVLDEVSSEPALIVSTPGAEPVASGGYSAALLLDTWLLLARPDLRAAEEAVRRWFNAAALVRSARDGGAVIIMGEPSATPLQAVVRWSPEGYAARELEERRTARLAPAAKLAELTGSAEAVADLVARLKQLVDPAAGLEVLGPVDVDDETVRAVVRTPRGYGSTLARVMKEAQAARSTKKLAGPLRVQIDPATFG
ncbi:replication restart DNA helicase PriA [Kribbella sp. VKM Ac-2527]|uniref:Probable replication restart protein PriA n=1 Tax=Kribbella caucasensis TaxID=2512215 RepID=A0A4R6KE18_9ACTN|nr:primosomal protein N' [Kribbella sp. VKM Ac-2527]TDO48602.1 replication restart DNA helicase PriA [Kribbella sp. VKM Ac-2527]